MGATLSVCIPNYNHARFLPQAIDAVLSQSRQPTEILVCDDASTDDSPAILDRYAAASPIVRVLRNERNLGVIGTLNRLLDESEGRWILCAGADDFLLPGALERSMDLLDANPQAGLCSGMVRLVDETGADAGPLKSAKVTDRPRYLPPTDVRRLRSRRAYSWFVVGNTAIYRRDAVREAGGLDHRLHAYCDSYMSQVIALRHGACFVPEPLAAWRRMDAGYASSFGRDDAVRREVYDRVLERMTTDDADVFDRRHATQWRRQAEVSDEAYALADRHGRPLVRIAARGGSVGAAAQQALRVGRVSTELALMVRRGLSLRDLLHERAERRAVRRER